MKKIQANVKVVIGLGVAVGILFIVVWGIISQHNQVRNSNVLLHVFEKCLKKSDNMVLKLHYSV